MTKSVVKKRVLISCIIVIVLTLLILFLTMWVPFLEIIKECNDVFSGKISSDNEHLCVFNFDRDYTAKHCGGESVKGSSVFLFSWHNGNTGYIYALSNRHYYDGSGNKLFDVTLDPVRIDVKKVNGVWYISNAYHTVI